MELLDVTEVSRVICHTNKGYLTLQLRKGTTDYQLVLDSVPLEEDKNAEVMDILFKKEIPTNIYSTPNIKPLSEDVKIPHRSKENIALTDKPKPRGRPPRIKEETIS